jgi:hypothetical protein
MTELLPFPNDISDWSAFFDWVMQHFSRR